MKRLTSLKSIAAAAVVLGAFGAASSAHAATDVFFSVQAPGVYLQTGPAYGYVQPQYVQPQYVQPQYGQTWYRGYQPQVITVYERDGWRHHRNHVQRIGAYGDYDRDGVPNRWDRAPANPYRR
jgi:hypothetical protein